MQKRPATPPPKPPHAEDAGAPLLPLPLRWGLLTGLVLIVAGGLWYWNAPGRDELSKLLLRSQQSLREGNLPAAYVDLQRALPHAPRSARVLETLADLAIRQQLLDDAEKWIDQIPDDAPETTAGLQISAAVLALDSGFPTRAEKWLRLALRNSSQDERQVELVRRLLARLYLLTFRQSEAREQIAALDRHVASTVDGELLLQYCAASRNARQGSEAQEWLRQSLSQEPNNKVIRAALAGLLLQSNQRDQARSLLQEVSLEDPESWRLGLVRAQDQIDSGRYPEAARTLNEIAVEADADARAWVARGRVAVEQHDLDTARAAFITASELDPLLTEPIYRLARLARQTGITEEGQARFRRADLLDSLHRTTIKTWKSPQEKRATLEETSSFVEQLGMPRLALLLCRAALAEEPESTVLQTRLKKLEQNPTAQNLLASGTPQQIPPRKILGDGRPSTRNRNSASTDPGASDRSPPVFVDVAQESGLNFKHYFSDAENHWLMETLGSGVSVLDYDADGWPDLFFAQGSPLPVPADSANPGSQASLFRNERGQGFTEVTLPSGIQDFGYGQGCAVGDIDNDGWPELLVCHYGAVRLYRNNGDGTFRDITVDSGLTDTQWSTSAAFGDFDQDGDLDLYVVHYVTAPWGSLRPCERDGQVKRGKSSLCRPTDYRATQDFIWENRGDGHFVERTADTGVIAPEGKGLAVVVEDLDNDGWPDIFVANDTTPSFLFHNRGRPSDSGKSPFSFRETGIPAGVAVSGQGDAQSSMGLACADADGDGYLDLFVTNFQEETNTFYRNLGELSFKDDTAKAQLLDLNPPKMGWGCQFIDSQSRGRPDLFYVNGHLLHTPQSPSFYANQGDRFTERQLTSSYFQTERLGRAVASLDWNRDLRPDLAITHLKGNVALLNNESPVGRSASIELVGRKSNRDAEGARIIVLQGSERRVYRVSRGGGFFAANEKTVLVGLGTRGEADSWEVRWPSGARHQGGKLSAGHRYRVVEGNSVTESSAF